MSTYNDHINMFDRINLADCAKRRASANVLNEDRFNGEYDTARLWMKYRLIKTTHHSYVEDN